MQSPFRRLDNALRPKNRELWEQQSKLVGGYEILTFLLVVPSIIVFQIGFIFVALNIWISSQIAKNRFVLSFASIVIFNISALPITYFYLLGLDIKLSFTSVAALLIFLVITFSSFLALYAQKREFGSKCESNQNNMH